MGDDPDRKPSLSDLTADDAVGADAADEQAEEEARRRGRERMIRMWRAAVQSVTEAAARERAQRADEHRADDADGLDDDGAEPAPTWVFPPRRAAGSHN